MSKKSVILPSSLTITPSNIEKQIVGVFLNIQDLFFIMGTDIFEIDANILSLRNSTQLILQTTAAAPPFLW